MRMILYVALALAVGLTAPFALAFDTNVDLKKSGGDDAFDIAIVLAGHENVTGTYDGYPSGRFQTKTIDKAGSNTVIHWEAPTGSVAGDGVQNGEVVHVGFSTGDGDAEIVDSYWTDEDGARIFGSTVLIVGGHVGRDWIGVTNRFPLVAEVNVRAVGLDAPMPLAELNAQNEELMALLEPVGGPLVLGPGETVELPLPDAAAGAAAVVVLIESQGPGSQAVAQNFQQRTFAESAADLP